MATSPVLINSLVGLFGNVHGGSFTEAQVQTVLLTDAVTNACTWAVAFHTALALKEGIDPADVQAIREGRLPKDSKLAALSALAKTMIEKRGRLDDRGRRAIPRGRFRQRSCSRGDRRGRRVDDHELHRQHHEASSRSAVSGSCLGRLRGPHCHGGIGWPRADRSRRLVLLRHKMRDLFRAIFPAQQGHLDRRLASATIIRRRKVAIEFGM